MARLARRPSNAFLVSLAILLALFHALLGVTAKIGTSVTFDEIAHLTAGHVYNTLGDFRLHPENGNLPQRWAALPMQVMKPRLPATDRSSMWTQGYVWGFAREFFYSLGNNTDLALFAGRAMVSLLSAATGLLVFFWSRRFFGLRGAFLSLGFFAFSPTYLAHGALATSDAAMACFFLAAVTAWWWQLNLPSLWRATLSGIVLGFALVAKFSAVLLGPMFGVLALLYIARAGTERHARPRAIGWVFASSGVHVLIGLAIVWSFYAWRFSPTPEPFTTALGFQHPWAEILKDSGWIGDVIAAMRDAHLLPEAYLYGFATVLQYAKQRLAFFNGEVGLGGWPAFFPFAFMVKTSVPLLATCGALLLISLRRIVRRVRGLDQASPLLGWGFAPLAVLFVVYAAASIVSHLNIGHRHLLPLYPVLFIAVGAFGSALTRSQPVAAALVLGALAWHVGESLRIRPYYLAYFNQLVGGPSRGYHHLVDSSLDWGQELPRLREWLARQPDARGAAVYIAYFGTGDPAYEGIRAQSIAGAPGPEGVVALTQGIYAVSATYLQQVHTNLRGGWTEVHERHYQNLRHRFEAGDSLGAQAELFNGLRLARLCTYLRARDPDAMIGYSLFVYRVTARELTDALDGTPQQLANAIERALHQRAP